MHSYDFSQILQYTIGELKSSPFIHPTNSCYGFGGNIYNADVYSRIYDLKNRDVSKPFFITVENIDMLYTLVDFDPRIGEITNKYPETICTFILPRTERIPDYINPGLDTIGIQVASGPLKKLFACIDFPIFGTSANISSLPPIYTADEILRTFGQEEDIIFFDGGDLLEAPPSTIIDLTKDPYTLIRGELR